MSSIGFFTEMHISEFDNGSISDSIVDKVDYDKESVIKYLSSFKPRSICPRYSIDCVTGENISTSFSVYTDGELVWTDFLIYHIRKYNIKLPQELIEKSKSIKAA